MTTLRISLTPMAPYFLGGERCDAYGTFISQQAAVNPYFLRSGKLLSQSTLFGVLRYLGIRNPQSDFELGPSKEYIGETSFNLTAKEMQTFGKIEKISNLFLTDTKGDYWCSAPRNHVYSEKDELIQYDHFERIESICGARYLPSQYREKNHGSALFIRMTNYSGDSDPNMYLKASDVFDSTVNVGIRRSVRNEKDDDSEQRGFFKREYTVMKPGYQFVFFAELQDDAFGENAGFTKAGHRAVSVGRYHAMFNAEWQTVKEKPEAANSLAVKIFDAPVVLDHPENSRPKFFYAWLQSDLYYPGRIEDLRAACVLMLGDYREQRVFTTNYGEVRAARTRFKKHETALKLISAGTVFVFESYEQKENFKKLLHQCAGFRHAQTAGYNCIYYSGEEQTK